MSLQKYNKKRKFTTTPEPEGKPIKTTGPLTFVVQKHHASRLHYDFRLELDGVLKSWAVPKGPSMDTNEKRLAMMVEDHPLDYANFEGIIPKGNYGAGTVMVWDNGVYTGVANNKESYLELDSIVRSDSEKLLREQLERGHLTFVLLGQKLKGEFALVKIQNPTEGENAWLLVKKRDEFAQGKIDILKQDRSALTNRTMFQIGSEAVEKNQVWHSKSANLDLDAAPRRELPHHIKPMLAHQVDKPFNDKEWIFELKWDGYRAIAEIVSGNVKLYSRNQQSFEHKFAPIVKSLKLLPSTAILDGEIVVLDEKGFPSFQALQDYPKKAGRLVYYVFDLLHFDGHSLKGLPLYKRKQILKQILPTASNVVYCDQIEEEGESFFHQAEKLGLEGIMAKKKDSLYIEGTRTYDWLKIKTSLQQTAIIGGFTKPKGGRKHFGALVLGIFDKDKLRYIGHTGGGFDDNRLKQIFDKLQPLIQSDCPFKKEPETNAPVTWVKPELSCRVNFASWTDQQIMRQPVFIDLIEYSKLGNNQRIFATESPKKSDSKKIQINSRSIEVTNFNKVFWPDDGYTKGDLVEFYQQLAPIILPYLKNRPQSLQRFPNGIMGESFYQKDASHLKTDWLLRGKIHSNSKHESIEYLLCQDEASLIYMINLGCIDLNPWNSTIQHLDKPDYLVIDLDPEGIPFGDVVNVALVCREVLEGFNIHSYPKTSGATGIHIYIPLAAKYTYEQARYFTELLCTQIYSKKPDLTSMVRSPKNRQGKVYLDFLQNIQGQTLASVYSVRARPGAPVSTPLMWSELNKKLNPEQFTIKNTLKRIESKGDIFKGVLGKGINIQNILKKININ